MATAWPWPIKCILMGIDIYHYALCSALTLMLFFSYRFCLGKLPDREIYLPYRISRMLMGVALLFLSANYSVHLFVTPRQHDATSAILMNLVTYWAAVWLFGSALMMLLDRSYVTRRRFVRYVLAWVGYLLVALALWLFMPRGLAYRLCPIPLALLFLGYAVRVARKVFVTFRKAARTLDNYYSDDAAAYIRWMSIFTYWAIIYGVGQGVFTFVPDRFVYIWIISSIPFYAYLYVSYTNYLLFYEQVAGAFCENGSGEPGTRGSNGLFRSPDGAESEGKACGGMSRAQEELIEQKISEWIESKGFATKGLTIMDMARLTGTNRTYISAFVNNHYGTTFREWVNGLRLDYAMELMREQPDMPISEVARCTGYTSPSHFARTFREKMGTTPGHWCQSTPHQG